MRQNMGVCRFLYNEYLNMNIGLYKLYKEGALAEGEDHFISAIDFDKYVNRELKSKDEFAWIGLCGSKARKKAIGNAQAAYMNYFRNERRFPQFKCYGRPAAKLYYPRNNAYDWTIGRDFVKVPTFGRVRLKERGYLPADAVVMSGTISYFAGRYFVSVLVQQEPLAQYGTGECLHVQFDAECFVRCGDVRGYNVEALAGVKRLKKALRREKRSLRRKAVLRNYSVQMEKQRLRVEKLRYRLSCIRQDFIKKLTASIVGRAPSCLVLDKMPPLVKGRDYAYTAQERILFYVFTRRLMHKAQLHGIKIIDNV